MAEVVKRPEHLGYPDFESLPETAAKIVTAAREMLVTGGWSSLTIRDIAKKAGVYVPSVNYYFGSRNGLIAMIFDSIMRETIAAMEESIEELRSSEDRVAAIAKTLEAKPGIAGPEGDIAFFETLPHMIRDPQLRERTLERYAAWESAATRILSGSDDPAQNEPLRSLAVLLLAVIDGLAIRRLLDPKSQAFDQALELFTALLSRTLENS